jgi:hypothetical protein
MAPESSIHIKSENRLETITGLILAVFAAMLAIFELGSGKFGKEQLIANNQKTEAYEWYQSKSIKQTLTESHSDLIKTFIKGGLIDSNKKSSVNKYVGSLDAKVKRYDKEKNEILKGSDAVGKENWVQDKDGKMGVIIGADEWQEKSEKLAGACDTFELALLFMQVCMVIGAISLVIKQDGLKKTFLIIMIVLGIIGIIYGVHAFMLANAA